jgi:putative chitinase
VIEALEHRALLCIGAPVAELTPDDLKKLMPRSDVSQAYASSMNAAMAEQSINGYARQAVFLSQLAVESDQLRRFEENLDYSAKNLLRTFPRRFDAKTAKQYAHKPEMIANRAYANVNGNGDEASGDGWKYRGRGPIQLTGRGVYATASAALGVGTLLVDDPDLVKSDPSIGIRFATWFFQHNGMNTIADGLDASYDKPRREANEIITNVNTEATRVLNDALFNLGTRLKYLKAARKLDHCLPAPTGFRTLLAQPHATGIWTGFAYQDAATELAHPEIFTMSLTIQHVGDVFFADASIAAGDSFSTAKLSAKTLKGDTSFVLTGTAAGDSHLSIRFGMTPSGLTGRWERTPADGGNDDPSTLAGPILDAPL